MNKQDRRFVKKFSEHEPKRMDVLHRNMIFLQMHKLINEDGEFIQDIKSQHIFLSLACIVYHCSSSDTFYLDEYSRSALRFNLLTMCRSLGKIDFLQNLRLCVHPLYLSLWRSV